MPCIFPWLKNSPIALTFLHVFKLLPFVRYFGLQTSKLSSWKAHLIFQPPHLKAGYDMFPYMSWLFCIEQSQFRAMCWSYSIKHVWYMMFFFAFDWNTSLHPPKRGYSWLIMQDKILEQNQIDDQNVALQGCQIQAARGKTRLILVPFYINYILVEWCSSIPDKTHPKRLQSLAGRGWIYGNIDD